MVRASDAATVAGGVSGCTPIHFQNTLCGFEYGAARITRHCHHDRKGWVWIGIETPKYACCHELKLHVTKSGKVRIFGAGGEWTPQKKGGGK